MTKLSMNDRSIVLEKQLYSNLSVAEAIEHSIKNKEGSLGNNGELIVESGQFTGRSPKDKFIVDEETTRDKIWWGHVNQKISESAFNEIYEKVIQQYKKQNLYLFEGYCGLGNHQLKTRIYTIKAWHYLFVLNMFIRRGTEDTSWLADFTLLNACFYKESDYKRLGLRSENFIIFNIKEKIAIIGGTEYAGEMKKGLFSIMNYLLPEKGVFPMHCSANVGKDETVALFFGLSGTGKTTLSTESNRKLIGDDEHGWSDEGIFNFEGGCYAKTIQLSPKKEPEIWNAIKFGSILENVVFDQTTRKVNFDDDSITENTRVSYPIHFIENIQENSVAGHPKNIIFLVCDTFGVLPPVAHLNAKQASYHFLLGYTAKVAGTERGIKEPQAVFSTCFGEPFLTQNPKVYADLLTQKVKKYQAQVYLVNTGWTGGHYGVGQRIDLQSTRTIINSILNNEIQKSTFVTDSIFGFKVPQNIDGLSDQSILNSINTWKDKNEYQRMKKKLAQMFIDNFDKFSDFAAELKNAGPKLDHS